MLRFFIQFVTVLLLFIFSTIFAWYEGSTILDNPWEWGYSTPFSQLLNGEAHSASDVSHLTTLYMQLNFNPLFQLLW
ncbi:DUF4306 domain-containing protein [Viridibacillus arvi]|uniref:DUF4306 domain-containing protein n=1 Tax=Viridibacillus arvi TaxID=263475 RepID=UPI003CFF6B4D